MQLVSQLSANRATEPDGIVWSEHLSLARSANEAVMPCPAQPILAMVEMKGAEL